jgi:hypothetical protein
MIPCDIHAAVDGQQLACSLADQTIQIWDLDKEGPNALRLTLEVDTMNRSLCSLNDSTHLIT